MQRITKYKLPVIIYLIQPTCMLYLLKSGQLHCPGLDKQPCHHVNKWEHTNRFHVQGVNIASISSIGSAIVIFLATCLCSLTPRPSLPFVGMRLCSPVWLVCLRYQIACIGKIFATNFQLDTKCKIYGTVSLMVYAACKCV